MSSSELAISVRGLSKSYTITHSTNDHITLAEVVLHRILHPLHRAPREEFRALNDIDFDVKKGEVLGVIGRNGAGKSTLLKLLTRITAPTAGRIDLWGRVGSLLEVGTGFHPELTGRENIYLNGSILGMTGKEINQQFDAIVDFAGVERFLDTPVKRYSSGMYVRLAFSVAAHLETEILLVDEVLAVGDAEFQARCLAKMRDVTTVGRTVLFVSHQMSSIQTLCDRAILLESGQLAFVGDVNGATEQYLRTLAKPSVEPVRRRSGLSGEIQLERTWVQRDFTPEEEKVIHFRLIRRAPGIDRFFVSVIFRASGGAPVAHCDSNTVGFWYVPEGDTVEGSVRLKTPWLLPGNYNVDVFICNAGVIDAVENACAFTVVPVLPYSVPPDPEVAARDLVLPDYRFDGSLEESSPTAGGQASSIGRR